MWFCVVWGVILGFGDLDGVGIIWFLVGLGRWYFAVGWVCWHGWRCGFVL